MTRVPSDFPLDETERKSPLLGRIGPEEEESDICVRVTDVSLQH